ncbi:type VII secretion-associated serine protease mycosin [Saccharothrix violaceirubra]|uniref:Membrane-anchored mycosin MYCP n=1 Tax=Saccharothrix violaceirubra TaxID=413306 RepID=A0A7W7SXW2_9PSEU|nr:type VII secretion-associated serine protease mycosin [Saccharothrix violaceirubra]MBB4962924.1 membrane-anchored mycosin MYCP [Saccharothrix violaceirubra]
MHRTTKKLTAAAAVALTLVTTPLAQAQPTTTTRPGVNSVPPKLEPGLRPPAAKPAPDVPYEKKKTCITSDTKDRPLPQKPWGQMQLRLEEAHRFATGKGVTLAIIDTGVNASHPRLAGRVTGGGDYVANEGGTVDCDGHGTEVAGVAAASRDEDTGFVGAAPDVKVLSFRQTSSYYTYEDKANKANSRPSAGRVQTLAQAIVMAAEAGVGVINISLTACEKPREPSTQERQLQAAIDYAVNVKDVVIVTAAGNYNSNDPSCNIQNDNQDSSVVNVVASPPWYANDVLSVASMNREGQPSSFTVWGPWVSVAAPGEEITTLDPAGAGLTNANVDERGALIRIQGTSFASPYVAGVAALVRERFPKLTAHQVMDRIKATAQHPGNPGGRDHKIGAGMVNPVAALTAELPMERTDAKPADPDQMITNLDPLDPPNRTPMIVALAGTGAGVGLLLLTLFVVHTVNRNRNRAATPRRASP